MSQWTDEQLSDLLRQAFAERESQADPDVARRIAREVQPARRRLWPVAMAAAAAVVLAAVAVQALQHIDSRGPRPQVGPTASAVHPVPAGHNRAAAIKAAGRIFRQVPLPPGAVSQRDLPPPELRKLGAYVNDVDRSLTRTGFWIVPMSHVDLVDWYAARTPANPDETKVSGSSVPEPSAVMEWEHGAPTSAYTQPAVVVSYARLGPQRTALRIDVTLASRSDRTAETLVPVTRLTSATITRTPEGNPTPKQTVAVSDPLALSTLGSAYNRALGDAAGSGNGPCGSPTNGWEYAVTFRWPGHALEVTKGMPLCRIGRDLVLDGVRLPERVDSDDPELSRALAHAYAAGQ